MPATFLYFAYGSNLLSARLRERTPSARVVGVGHLRQHELRWHMLSTDGSGKCDIVQAAGPAVHVQGVVYEIFTTEKPHLDAAETLGVGYAEKEVEIELASGRLQASVYHALAIDPMATPYDWYKNIVVAGAREHGLAADYILQLERAPMQADPDPRRSVRHAALLHRARAGQVPV